MNKLVSIVGTVGVPACYGGFETLVENLVGHSNIRINVYCSSRVYKHKLKKYKGANLIYIPFKANGFQSIIYDSVSLLHALIKKSDVVLVLGVSGGIFLPLFKKLSKSKVITNIDGLEWKRDKWNKPIKKFLRLSERMAIRFSDEIIADNEAISNYIKIEYKKNSSTIAYGGDHAPIKSLKNNIDNNFALALCRIEPENNIEMILESFSQSNKYIKFIGNWTDSAFGLQMKKKYKNLYNIEIIDSIYDDRELHELRSSCSYYVHGHSAGGTNPSLVEMMHFEKTILCFDCNYNRLTTDNLAYYFKDSISLNKLINLPRFKPNGADMKRIADLRYTWDIIRKQYFDLILKQLNNTEKN